ncbi:MAG TPA: hypothetical protein VJ872_10030, partial [Nocardioides sp.]|nr:hypothetical protein [Nocardioides sp.]
MSAGGAKLQPIAALCAVLMVIWGGVAVASVVAQIEINHKLDLWPSTLDSWAAWSVLLSFAAAAVGVPVVVCGIVGFGRRSGLHVGGLLVLLSIALTFGALVIDNVKFHVPWFGNSQSLWLNYRYGLTWHDLPAAIGFQRWWFFAEYLLLPLAGVVLLVWLVVLASGAGRRAPSSGLGYAYVAAPQADYRYVVAPDQPAKGEVAEEHAVSEPAREVPPLIEPRDVPAPSGATPEAAPAEAAPVEHAEDEVPEQAPADDARPADDERVWFVTVQGADHGPYSRTQLRSYADEGRL